MDCFTCVRNGGCTYFVTADLTSISRLLKIQLIKKDARAKENKKKKKKEKSPYPFFLPIFKTLALALNHLHIFPLHFHITTLPLYPLQCLLSLAMRFLKLTCRPIVACMLLRKIESTI